MLGALRRAVVSGLSDRGVVGQVYKIPPRQTSQGHRAADWNGNHLWTGRCRVVGKGEVCEIKLEDPQTGNLFAACPVTLPGPDQAPSVEPVMDSSRYFVLRIEDGTGAIES
jgi:hypothetical protein